MKLKNRFLLVGFGVLVFVIATPILVLYARGFKIDWTHGTITKTGTLVAKTLPAKAAIFLNGKKQKNLTPDTIRFLLPGDYVVRVEKEGFQSWTKRLSINAQFATWANLDRDFVTLFFTQAQQLSTSQVRVSSISENNSELSFVSNDNLSLLNTNNLSSQDLGNISSFPTPFTFTPILSWENGINTFNFFNSLQSTNITPPQKITKVDTNGTFTAITANGQLYSFISSTLGLIDKNISATLLADDTVWYVSDQSLKTYNLRTTEQKTISSKLPKSSTAKIAQGEGKTFLILDNSLYILNDNLEKIYDGVNFANYDTASHVLLFANNNEILTYDPSLKTSNLILRSISPVSNPLLNTYTGYVFFNNENKIKAVELDGRDHRNIYTIADLPGPDSHFTLSIDGSNLTVFNNAQVITYKIR